MFPASSREIRVEHAGFVICSALFVMLFATTGQAQLTGTGIDDDPASGMRNGTNTIVGRVTYPSGRQLDRRYTVRLSSVVVGEFSTTTDENGVFTFRRLRDGTYSIRVEAGKEYLPAQETVELYDNRGRTITVQIELRPKPVNTSKPRVVNAALAGVPKPAQELYQKAMVSAAAGEYKKAIEQLKSAVAIYPQFVLALNELSAGYINLAELEPAADALRAALKIEPNNPTLRLNYGYVLMLRKQFVDSERELHRAIELKDDSVTAHLYRGRVLIRLRNFDEAEKELNRALSLGGASGIVAHRYLGALYSERGETAKAIGALENYLKLAPNAKDAEQVQAIIKQLQEQSNKKD